MILASVAVFFAFAGQLILSDVPVLPAYIIIILFLADLFSSLFVVITSAFRGCLFVVIFFFFFLESY